MNTAVSPPDTARSPSTASPWPAIRRWLTQACAALIAQRRKEALRQLRQRYGDFDRDAECR